MCFSLEMAWLWLATRSSNPKQPKCTTAVRRENEKPQEVPLCPSPFCHMGVKIIVCAQYQCMKELPKYWVRTQLGGCEAVQPHWRWWNCADFYLLRIRPFSVYYCYHPNLSCGSPPCLLITDFITSPFICLLSEQFTFHPLGAFLDETPFISHHNVQ